MKSCSSILDPEPYAALHVWRAVKPCSSMLDPGAVRRFASLEGSELL